MKKLLVFIVLASTLVVILVVLTINRDHRIVIGAIGDYSTSNSTASVDAFRAIEYAIEELNADEEKYVLKRFDLGHLVYENPLFEEMIREKVDVVIGPVTSSQYLEYEEQLADLDLPVFLNSVSSNQVSDKKDNMFRLTDSVDIHTEYVLKAINDFFPEKTIDVIYTELNIGFTEPFALKIEAGLKESGNMGELISVGDIEDEAVVNMLLEERDSHGFFIIAGLSRAGIIAQLLAQNNHEQFMFFDAWGKAEETLEYTMAIKNPMYSLASSVPRDIDHYNMLVSQIEEKKNINFNTFAFFGYETMYFIDEMIHQSESYQLLDLQREIHKLTLYKGRFNDYRFNDCGDGGRGYALMVIHEGEYVFLDDLMD